MIPIRTPLTRVSTLLGFGSAGRWKPYRSTVAVLSAGLVVAALVLVAPQAQAHHRSGGWGSGTLTESELHALVAQMTLAEEAGMVHGEGDPPNSPGANASCTASPVGCV